MASPNFEKERNIFLLCEGTGNTYLTSQTNVLRLYNILRDSTVGNQIVDHSNMKYMKGVGILDSYDEYVPGFMINFVHFYLSFSFAVDIQHKLLQGYTFICERYTALMADDIDPRLWIFGFSRGAYTTKALVDIISKYGVVDLSKLPSDCKDSVLNRAISGYYTQLEHPKYKPNGSSIESFRNAYSFPNSWTGKVYFVGVWDIVGAVGVPKPIPATGLMNDQVFTQELAKDVTYVRHALAIHENMVSFEPTHLVPTDGPWSSNWEEVWFPGRHLDIGGFSGPRNKISNATLEWMLKGINEALKIKSDSDFDLTKVTEPEWFPLYYDFISFVYNAVLPLWAFGCLILKLITAYTKMFKLLRDRVIPHGTNQRVYPQYADINQPNFGVSSETLKIYEAIVQYRR